MVNKQVIASPFFSSRGRISPVLLRSLLVRGRGIQVDDLLRRNGWDGTTAAAAPVLTLDPDSGRITGARFETRGRGPQEVRFKASELWGEMPEDALVTLKFPDLSRLEWRGEGPARNQTVWLDSDDVEVTFTKGDGERLEIAEEATIGKFAVRFTILPVKVDRLVLYGSIVPMGKEALREKMEEGDLDLDSPLVPTIALKLWYAKGKLQNGFPVVFLPGEKVTDKVGLGVLPIIEAIGSGDPVLPGHEDLEEQLCLMLRDLTGTNNVSPQRFANIMASGSLPSSVSGLVSFLWPEYKGPLAGGSRERNVTGLLFFVSRAKFEFRHLNREVHN